MDTQFSRTEMLIGTEAVQKLNHSKVVIFGLGGVGSFVVEALARAGIGSFILVDHDTISISNINRQLIATHDTIGKNKVEIAKSRILSINPKAKITTYTEFFMPESTDLFDQTASYVIDCIDTVTAKIEIIKRAKERKVPVISCMGTGNKLDPSKFEITDISKTSVCPLAKVMRKELAARNIKNVKVLYSKETPMRKVIEVKNISTNENNSRKQVPASISFVPSVAGLMIAGEVIKDIIDQK